MARTIDFVSSLRRARTSISNDPQATARLEALFAELADSTTCTGGSVEIEGRAIPVVKESENVIWFEFEALCEGPRSQDDYIEIAREYQSVIVSKVPQLTATRENASRRFIAMVDEFYDRHVNLILSAATPADSIYRGERLTFEFQRTVSRLIEMQSEEYLASEHRLRSKKPSIAGRLGSVAPLSRPAIEGFFKRLKQPPSNLIQLDRLEQRPKVTLPKPLIPLALNDLEKNRPDDVLRKDLQQHAFALLKDCRRSESGAAAAPRASRDAPRHARSTPS